MSFAIVVSTTIIVKVVVVVRILVAPAVPARLHIEFLMACIAADMMSATTVMMTMMSTIAMEVTRVIVVLRSVLGVSLLIMHVV